MNTESPRQLVKTSIVASPTTLAKRQGHFRAMTLLLAIVSSAPAAAWEAGPAVLKAADPLLIPTVTRYQGDKKRAAFRKQLVQRMIAAGKRASKGRKPVLYLMGGGGAAGKGTLKASLLEDGVINETGLVRIDRDEIKQSLPEYQQLVARNDSRAASVVHEESSQLAKEALNEAFKRHFNILLDVTLGDPDKGFAMVETAKHNGYLVHLIGVTVDPELALQRALQRGKSTRRWVPNDLLLKAHRGFSLGFERYAQLADRAELWDTTKATGDSVLVARKARGKRLQIVQPTAWAAFLGKARINPQSTTAADLYQ